MVRDYTKKSVLSTIKVDDEPDRTSMRLGSIVHSVEAKRVRENEKKP